MSSARCPGRLPMNTMSHRIRHMPPTRRHPWKGLAQIVLPISVSVVALVVSILTYVDQHNIDQATVISAQQAYASQVSFWLVQVHGSSTPQLVIQNRSFAPISNVFLQISASRYRGWLEIDTPAGVGTIPPCSLDTTSTLKESALAASHQTLGAPKDFAMSVVRLTFTDASGITWARLPNETLVRYTGNHAHNAQALNTPILPGNSISSAHGCS